MHGRGVDWKRGPEIMGAKSFRDTKKTREAWQAQEEDAQDTEVKGRDREGKRDKPFPICVPSIQCRTNVQKLETMTIVEARIDGVECK